MSLSACDELEALENVDNLQHLQEQQYEKLLEASHLDFSSVNSEGDRKTGETLGGKRSQTGCRKERLH